MGIRETINNEMPYKRLGAGLFFTLSILYLAHLECSNNGLMGTLSYYTTDDGQTFFIGEAGQYPPFDHGGKQACYATVISTDGGKTKTVAYLQRFTAAGKARLEAANADYKSGKTHTPPVAKPEEIEVKKPGADNPWVSLANRELAGKTMQLMSSSGNKIDIQEP